MTREIHHSCVSVVPCVPANAILSTPQRSLEKHDCVKYAGRQPISQINSINQLTTLFNSHCFSTDQYALRNTHLSPRPRGLRNSNLPPSRAEPIRILGECPRERNSALCHRLRQRHTRQQVLETDHRKIQRSSERVAELPGQRPVRPRPLPNQQLRQFRC